MTEAQKAMIEYFKTDDAKAAVKRGVEDYRAGRVRPWLEIKKELGL